MWFGWFICFKSNSQIGWKPNNSYLSNAAEAGNLLHSWWREGSWATTGTVKNLKPGGRDGNYLCWLVLWRSSQWFPNQSIFLGKIHLSSSHTGLTSTWKGRSDLPGWTFHKVPRQKALKNQTQLVVGQREGPLTQRQWNDTHQVLARKGSWSTIHLR